MFSDIEILKATKKPKHHKKSLKAKKPKHDKSKHQKKIKKALKHIRQTKLVTQIGLNQPGNLTNRDIRKWLSTLKNYEPLNSYF